MTFRPFDFSDNDYQAWLTIENTAHPEHPQSIEQAKHVDKTRGQEDVLGCFLVETNGQIIGWLQYETPRNLIPDALEFTYRLLPDYQHFTQELWTLLQMQLSTQSYKTLITRVYDNWVEKAFYESQGFTVYDSMWPSKLDLGGFDPQPFYHYVQKAEIAGIQIATLADFPHSQDRFRQQWYALMVELLESVPSAKPVVPWNYKTWVSRVPVNPNLFPETYFFALHDDELIGVSELYKTHDSSTLKTGLTAVKKTYQRQGIAQTLKLKAALFAKSYGATYITTNNHQINHPMLAINKAMGFKKEPALLFMKKDML